MKLKISTLETWQNYTTWYYRGQKFSWIQSRPRHSHIYIMTMSRVAVNRITNKLNLHANWWGQEGISPLGELHHCSLPQLSCLLKTLVPITGGRILKHMDQRSDLLWHCLAYLAWVGSRWKYFRSIYTFCRVFWGYLYCSVCLLLQFLIDRRGQLLTKCL